MIKLLPLALGVALAGTCAQAATTYVQAIGQSDDFTGSLNYTQRLENGITPVSDQKEITTSVVHAAFGSSAAYGLLKANSEIDALAFGGVIFGTTPRAVATADYGDWITVGGVAPVTLHFTMPTTGFFDPNSQSASVNSTLNASAYNPSGVYLGIDAYCAYQAHVQTGNYFLDSSILSSDITVAPGTRISLSAHLGANAQLYYLNPTFLKSEADFSHTSLSYIDVLTPGGSIVADSGHNYSSAAAAPEPSSLAFLGVAAILLRRRRTNR